MSNDNSKHTAALLFGRRGRLPARGNHREILLALGVAIEQLVDLVADRCAAVAVCLLGAQLGEGPRVQRPAAAGRRAAEVELERVVHLEGGRALGGRALDAVLAVRVGAR